MALGMDCHDLGINLRAFWLPKSRKNGIGFGSDLGVFLEGPLKGSSEGG